jgi:hypothetical protein
MFFAPAPHNAESSSRAPSVGRKDQRLGRALRTHRLLRIQLLGARRVQEPPRLAVERYRLTIGKKPMALLPATTEKHWAVHGFNTICATCCFAPMPWCYPNLRSSSVACRKSSCLLESALIRQNRSSWRFRCKHCLAGSRKSGCCADWPLPRYDRPIRCATLESSSSRGCCRCQWDLKHPIDSACRR